MNAKQLSRVLSLLTGDIISETPAQHKQLSELQQQLVKALRQKQDPESIRKSTLLPEQSDANSFVRDNAIPIELAETLLQNQKKISSKEPEIRITERRIPVRTTQIPGAASTSFAGARVHTLGPFIDRLGITRWFDWVQIKKLIRLYRQGQAEPVILFDARFQQPRLRPLQAPPVELTRSFQLLPETVWIQTKQFDPAAPANQYIGLRILSGTLTLDADPFMAQQKLSISQQTKISCTLKLDTHQSITLNTHSGDYGKDAREAKYDLPDTFRFTLQGNQHQILEIGQAAWKVYGQENQFRFIGQQQCVYNPLINRLGIPLDSHHSHFSVHTCHSPWHSIQGSAPIINSWWVIPSALLDVQAPPEADGNGGLLMECTEVLQSSWKGLQHKTLSLKHAFILGEPGRIAISEWKSTGAGAEQIFLGWEDQLNPHGTDVRCQFLSEAPWFYNSLSDGQEIIYTLTDVQIHTDRPLKANGEAVEVSSRNTALVLAMSQHKRQIMLLDQDILWDHKDPKAKIPEVDALAFVLHNALLTVTPPNSLMLLAELDENSEYMLKGQCYLGFGLFSYLPTLPDPYAANIGLLSSQFKRGNRQDKNYTHQQGSIRNTQVWLWLLARIRWEKRSDRSDQVGVSFHFAPLTAPMLVERKTRSNKKTANADHQIYHAMTSPPMALDQSHFSLTDGTIETRAMAGSSDRSNPIERISQTDFALLDVSSKANQMGVAFSRFNNNIQQLVARRFDINIVSEEEAAVFPLRIEGLDMMAAGKDAQAFTVPAIAWEPVFNLTAPTLKAGDVDDQNNPLPPPYDPPIGFNYYNSDGIATRIGNLSKEPVSLSPIPMAKYLVNTYKTKQDGKTFALFNLPFGMLALSILDNASTQSRKPSVDETRPVFDNYVNGGLQLELQAGSSFSPDDGSMFEGFTVQLININRADGQPAYASTLAGTPTQIFNNEFYTNSSNLPARPGVPVERIGISGYGASMFSRWENKEALFAQVSQAQFNVVTGRTNHEVVQVKSMLYPWGIRVVRTITLFRLANGYVARIDSGWKAESDGLYDFTWQKPILGNDGKTVVGKTPQPNPYTFHPGLVRGLFNIRHIREQPKIFSQNGVLLYAVTFNADVELENVSEGGQQNRVPSEGVLGYVQISPAGEPVPLSEFNELLKSENDAIGGSIACTLNIAGSPQRMRITRFDMNRSSDKNGNPIFVGAARGSVILPKDGSWSLVQHSPASGEVSPLSETASVPLIRIGEWIKGQVVKPADINNLLRIANPGDILKNPDNLTLHFGFLQNMGTQKVLFMMPGFKKGIPSLLSKTPPLFADAFRLMNGKGIFPNIGSLQNDFGQAISMLKGVGSGNVALDAFSKINVPDAGQVFNLLELKAKEEAGKLLDQGYKLAKGLVNGVANDALRFDLPSFDYPLVNLDGKLIIRIRYQADSKPKGQAPKNYVGKFDFDIDSFASDLGKTWKGRMNNLSMVVTLGPLTDVMTIKGNFNSQKGKEVDLGSTQAQDDPALNLPLPEIEFSDAVEPVIKVLELLASLSSGEYGDALKKGLKIAMSNSANLWEYKFEANKEIPLVRFPPTKALYDSPQTPLKLEASLGIGVFFNAALKVTSDPKQLLPTAGAYFKFHGGLQVMCVSVGAATIYAIGQVDLKLEADTSPKIAITMKFGFGAQITVGLPVVGHASVLFMVGLEVYADSGSKVRITASMLFRGHAEILGGLVSVTITIEAKGSVEKAGPGTPTECVAQVTFAIEISIFLIIDISFSESWEESRQIA